MCAIYFQAFPVIEATTMDFGDEKPIITDSKEQTDKKGNKNIKIAREMRTKKCRMIALAVMFVVMVAILVGVILYVT